MGRMVLVTGGARSGKSAFAEQLAGRLGERVTYVATAEAGDAEMAARIARHRARRPATWNTREALHDLQGAMHALEDGTDAVLIDSLSLWITNRLLALGDPERDAWWGDVADLEQVLAGDLAALLTLAREASWHLVVVTDEVGLGLVPPFALGRAFRDLLGQLNQLVAGHAGTVFLVVAGLGLDIRALAVAPENWHG